MAKALLVPIHLDALFLPVEDDHVEAMVDFSRLPYFDGERDVNGDRPYLSEELLSRPFQNRNLHLNAGVHLHWALPDALTRAFNRDSQTRFPRAPNRWLITRTGLPGASAAQHWVVESDFLHPKGGDRRPIGVSYPVNPDPEAKNRQPFRNMGRCLKLEDWLQIEKAREAGQPVDPSAEYLDRLTAMGYGEPSFAAFYPNCRSVFGFHDEEAVQRTNQDLPSEALKGTSYRVIGWYQDGEQDALRKGFVRFREEHARTGAEGAPSGADFARYLAEWFRWEVSAELVRLPDVDESGEPADPAFIERPLPEDFDLAEQLPERLICHSRITLLPTDAEGRSSAFVNDPPEVWVGNSGTEALSAYLAHELGDDVARTEDQLEALHLGQGLRDTRIDLGSRFRQARHEKSFVARESGFLWLVRAESEEGARALAEGARSDTQVTLPDDLADLLSEVNRLQDAYDRAGHEITSRREALYSDWYKYMLAAYPPADSRDELPDIDAVKHFVETKQLVPLEQLERERGRLGIRPDSDGGRSDATNDPSSIAARLQRALAALLSALNKHNVEPWLLRAKDVPDVPALVAALSHKPIPKALRRLRKREGLGDAELAAALASEEGAQALIAAINKALRKREFFVKGAFDEIELPPDLQSLLAEDRADFPRRRLVRLNRSLLDRVLPIVPSVRSAGASTLLLRRKPAPRYWQPRPPSVLLVGEAVRPTLRHGQDGRDSSEGLLACRLVEIDLERDLLATPTLVLDGLLPDAGPPQDRIGDAIWNANPWNPFLLEWKVQVHPFEKNVPTERTAAGKEEDAQREAEPDYDRGYLDDLVEVPEKDVELRPREDAEIVVTRAASIISGRSYLTSHPGRLLEEAVRRFFEPSGFLVSYEARNEEQRSMSLGDWADHLVGISFFERPADHAGDSLEEWTQHLRDEGQMPHPLEDPKAQLFKRVFETLRGDSESPSLPHLAQALSGLDDALLMKRLTFQLPVADPLAFRELDAAADDEDQDTAVLHYETFAEKVSRAVGDRNGSAPLPLNPFLPVRCGAMRLSELRLVDTFGQVLEIEPSSVGRTSSMVLPEELQFRELVDDKGDAERERAVWLPPRLAQPARLHFRWLAASDGELEVNDHPATSPICGWLLPNHLDQSLMVYDAEGAALGFIDQTGAWRPAPGLAGPVLRGAEPFPTGLFTNIRLERVVEVLKRLGEDEFQEFLAELDGALAEIDPENFSQHADFALLAGRPIAVARASLSLELEGEPAFHQGWSEFFQDLTRGERETLGFPRIELPVRLGERSQWNDGLLGYWEETENEIADAVFHRSQDGHVHQSIDAPPHRMTMLVDPRGVVHATSGLLPAKAIAIPQDQYSAAVQRLRITFLTAPLLTDQDAILIPELPAEEGFAWSFVASTKTGFVEVPGGELQGARFEGRFRTKQVLREGWLQLAPLPAADGDDQEDQGEER